MAAKVDASEEVAETKTQEVTCEDSDEAGNVENIVLSNKGPNCSKCGGPTKGHLGRVDWNVGMTYMTYI